MDTGEHSDTVPPGRSDTTTPKQTDAAPPQPADAAPPQPTDAAPPQPADPALPQPIYAAPPGWYPDPWGQHRGRFWNGADWTGYVVDEPFGAPPPWAPVAPSRPARTAAVRPRRHHLGGRLLWHLYAIPATLALLASVVSEVQAMGAVGVFDLIVSAPSLVALYLHIWDKKVLSATFWKPYAFGIVAWDLLFNLLIAPPLSGQRLGLDYLLGALTSLPLYIALFRYAYRDWSATEPNTDRSSPWSEVDEAQRLRRRERTARRNRILVALPGLAAPAFIVLRSCFVLSAALSVRPELSGMHFNGDTSARTRILIACLDLAMAGAICLALAAVALPRRLSARTAVIAMAVTLIPFGVALNLCASDIAVLPNTILAVSLAFTPGIALARLCRPRGAAANVGVPEVGGAANVAAPWGAVAASAAAANATAPGDVAAPQTSRLWTLFALPGLLAPALLAGGGILSATAWWSYWAALPPGPDGDWLARGGLVLNGLARSLALGMIVLGIVLCLALVAVVTPRRSRKRAIGGALAFGLSLLLLVVALQPDALSPNWAGYATSSGPFRSVTATWTQPEAAGDRGGHDSSTSFWVGLDGWDNGTVEQIGTSLDGTAWFEMYPGPSRRIDMSVVVPGDVVTASVTRRGPHTFVLKLVDNTTRSSFTTTQTNEHAVSASAEVIAEARSSDEGQLPLDAFGLVRFASCAVDGLPFGAYHPASSEIGSSRLARVTTTSAMIRGGSVFTVASSSDSPSVCTVFGRVVRHSLPSQPWHAALATLSLGWLLVFSLVCAWRLRRRRSDRRALQ